MQLNAKHVNQNWNTYVFFFFTQVRWSHSELHQTNLNLPLCRNSLCSNSPLSSVRGSHSSNKNRLLCLRHLTSGSVLWNCSPNHGTRCWVRISGRWGNHFWCNDLIRIRHQFCFLHCFHVSASEPAMDELVTSLLNSGLHSAYSAVQGKIQTTGCRPIKTELMSMITSIKYYL